MLKKVQMRLHKWLCVLDCFPVAVSDQLQALITTDSYVVTSNRAAGLFEGTAGMRNFIMLCYVITSNRVAGRFEGSAGMGSLVQNTCDLALSR